MEAMLVNIPFIDTKKQVYDKNQIWFIHPKQKAKFINRLNQWAREQNNPEIAKSLKFFNLDNYMKPATNEANFKNLLLIRSGGIGDLIALSSIVDYFNDKNIYFVTNSKYVDIFEWFVDKPFKILPLNEPIFNNWNNAKKQFGTWARFKAEGMIEKGDRRNWFEIFFECIGIDSPEKEYLRPELSEERINDLPSGVQEKADGRKSLLISNKASAMMRSIHVSDILKALPKRVFKEYQVFVYDFALTDRDRKIRKKVTVLDTDLKGFLRDCFDADQVISVDTGALHFREGVKKPAIGLYNSFTSDCRTRHYKYTRSYDTFSKCDLQPCFYHEHLDQKFCPRGNETQFAAPCFDSNHNKNLISRLKTIFNIHF